MPKSCRATRGKSRWSILGPRRPNSALWRDHWARLIRYGPRPERAAPEGEVQPAAPARVTPADRAAARRRKSRREVFMGWRGWILRSTGTGGGRGRGKDGGRVAALGDRNARTNSTRMAAANPAGLSQSGFHSMALSSSMRASVLASSRFCRSVSSAAVSAPGTARRAFTFSISAAVSITSCACAFDAGGVCCVSIFPATCAPISMPSPRVNSTRSPCAWARMCFGAAWSV